MIWLTWRQFRTQTWIAAGLLAALAGVLAIAAAKLASLYQSSGLADCSTDCDALASSFIRTAGESGAGIVYYLSVGVMYATPALIGAFWGAPLVARELETGTHRLIWNQTVTRTRWLLTKLLGIGLVAMATTGLLSLAVAWSGTRVDAVLNERIMPYLFGTRGIVPIAYAAFAFALGVALGMLIRRSIPAMAVSLAIYVVAIVASALFVRPYLAPIHHSTTPLDTTRVYGLMIYGDSEIRVIGETDLTGAWVLVNRSITAQGTEFTGPPDLRYCGDESGAGECLNWINTLNLRMEVAYHPAEQFWRLQWTEAGLFLGLAVLLSGFCVWWLRRRLA